MPPRVHGEPVLEALLHAQQGNPVFDEGMMGRSRQVAAELLSPLIAHDPALADAELFDSLVEVTTRLGLSIVLFESDALREEEPGRGLSFSRRARINKFDNSRCSMGLLR